MGNRSHPGCHGNRGAVLAWAVAPTKLFSSMTSRFHLGLPYGPEKRNDNFKFALLPKERLVSFLVASFLADGSATRNSRVRDSHYDILPFPPSHLAFLRNTTVHFQFHLVNWRFRENSRGILPSPPNEIACLRQISRYLTKSAKS